MYPKVQIELRIRKVIQVASDGDISDDRDMDRSFFFLTAAELAELESMQDELNEFIIIMIITFH